MLKLSNSIILLHSTILMNLATSEFYSTATTGPPESPFSQIKIPDYKDKVTSMVILMRIGFEFFICLVLIFIVGTDTIFSNMATPRIYVACPLVIRIVCPLFENLKRFQVFSLLNTALLGRMVREWDDYEVVHFKAIVGIVNLDIFYIATC